MLVTKAVAVAPVVTSVAVGSAAASVRSVGAAGWLVVWCLCEYSLWGLLRSLLVSVWIFWCIRVSVVVVVALVTAAIVRIGRFATVAAALAVAPGSLKSSSLLW